jgi:hypothetical protein
MIKNGYTVVRNLVKDEDALQILCLKKGGAGRASNSDSAVETAATVDVFGHAYENIAGEYAALPVWL